MTKYYQLFFCDEQGIFYVGNNYPEYTYICFLKKKFETLKKNSWNSSC
jgi:hypothetical protein